MKVGDVVFARRDIIEPATGDHPEFLMAVVGDRLRVVHYATRSGMTYPVLVEHVDKDQSRWPRFSVAANEVGALPTPKGESDE